MFCIGLRDLAVSSSESGVCTVRNSDSKAGDRVD